MSELKVFDCQGCLYHDVHFFYSKSEADKVIAELKNVIEKQKRPPDTHKGRLRAG